MGAWRAMNGSRERREGAKSGLKFRDTYRGRGSTAAGVDER